MGELTSLECSFCNLVFFNFLFFFPLHFKKFGLSTNRPLVFIGGLSIRYIWGSGLCFTEDLEQVLFIVKAMAALFQGRLVGTRSSNHLYETLLGTPQIFLRSSRL